MRYTKEIFDRAPTGPDVTVKPKPPRPDVQELVANPDFVIVRDNRTGHIYQVEDIDGVVTKRRIRR